MEVIKIINDPVYGFIHIYSPLILEIIDHPLFQRLRRIRQLGVTEFVYPGAVHSRYQHALGAMHLTGKTLSTLRSKGVTISDEEFISTQIAVLLHDIGHGPFSHSLEEVLLTGITHESVSYRFMKQIDERFDGALDLTLRIFRNSYARPFFHELVNSQLDLDRLDYLKRDSFFTGVPEGSINVERIIQLLNVRDDKLVAEEKAIYTIENFLNARRLMYWQVYLHKASLGADKLLVNIISRAREMVASGQELPGSAALLSILAADELATTEKEEMISVFGKLDDHDVTGAIKMWCDNKDKILSILCRWFLDRKLFEVDLGNEPVHKEDIMRIKGAIAKKYNVLNQETRYFLSYGKVTNEAYLSGGKGIHMLKTDGSLMDIAEAADLPNIQAMSKVVSKYFICKPRKLFL